MKYRSNGIVGALLDEYEKAINELREVINGFSANQLTETIDFITQDKDCKSIQAILSHVIESGYTYVIEIRKWLGETIDYQDKLLFNNVEDYNAALIEMFKFNEQLFIDYPNLKLEEFGGDKKIKVRWGQLYDVEQLFEHAIMHILRHRRQIEKFKLLQS